MMFAMGMALQTIAPAALVIWMAFYVQRRLAVQERRHREEMERLVEVLRKMLSAETPPPIKIEDGLDGAPVVLIGTPAPLPVARALKT
jgi:hypothetical protein